MEERNKEKDQLIQDLKEMGQGFGELEKSETGLKRAEKSWQEGERFLAGIFASIQDGISILDDDLNIIRVNPAMERWYSHARPLVGKKCYEAYHEQSEPCRVCPTVQTLKTGKPAYEVVAKKGTGGEIVGWLDLYSFPLVDPENGKMKGVIEYVRDITERKKAEEERQKSGEEARRLAQENAIMAEIGRIISSTLNIEEVYERFAKEVNKLIPFDRIAINMNHRAEGTITNAYVSGIEVAGRRPGEVIPLAGSINEKILRAKKSLLIQTEDQEDLARSFPSLMTTFQAGLRSMMSVPLLSQDRVIGVLHFRSLKPNAYTGSDIRLAESVAAQIAGAIANAQLFLERRRAEVASQKSGEEAKRLAQENAIMAEIGRVISSTPNIEEVYERFAEEVRQLIQFDRIAINILNPEDNTFMIPYVLGPKVAEREVGKVLPLTDTAAQWVMQNRSSMLVLEENWEEAIGRFPGLLPNFRAGHRSVMLIPLISKDQVIGVLNLQTLQQADYTRADLELAERVGTQIAGAMANGMLLHDRKMAEEALRRSEEEAKWLAKESAVLAEIGRIFNSTLNIEEVYEWFVKEAQKLIPFDRISINLIHLENGRVFVAYVSGLDIPGRRLGDSFLLKDSATEKIRLNRLSLLIQPETVEVLESQFVKFVPHFQSGIRSMMAIPLISRDTMIGVLHLQSTGIKAYTEKDLRLAERIAAQIAGAIANAQLFAERKRAEEALQASEEKYRLLIQNSNDAIFIAQDGVIKFPNLKTEQLLGYSAAELARIPFINHVHPDDREMVLENHKRRLEGQKLPSTYSFRVRNKSVEELWAEINAVFILWEGRPASLNFIRDITEKKKLEARYLQAQKMEAVGTLAGGVAHDFNNLLMGIQGHTSLMLLDIDPSHPHYKMLKSVEEQVKSGADLTWQLLSFARGGKIGVKPMDLNAIIKKSSTMFGRTQKEVSIHRDLQQDLWPVEIDRGQIEQVLLNLYVNAWQAMPNGGSLFLETKNIVLDEQYRKPFYVKPGNYVKISVTDTGVGMDEKTLKRIFEPFFTTKEMGRGTGLGLATAYGIIKGHGGIINVYSEKGHGATFTLYLPASEKKIEKEKKSPEEPRKGKETILLVDDEEVVLNVNRMVLERLGYGVFVARSGQEAIEVFRAKKDGVHLVILDLIMPGMEGGKVFDHLKSIKADVKVILSSGYSFNDEVGRMMERGCQAFIQKPFDIGEFSQKIRDVLGAGKMRLSPPPTGPS